MPLLAESETLLFMEGTNVRVEFERDAGGVMAGLVVHQGVLQERAHAVAVGLAIVSGKYYSALSMSVAVMNRRWRLVAVAGILLLITAAAWVSIRRILRGIVSAGSGQTGDDR